MLEKLFGFDKTTMNLKSEIVGGITTFLTMAYILAVNPSILAATGMDQGAVFTASALAAVVATLVMAIYAKLPFALAPGMGVNAFFAYTIVLAMGYTWQFALTAVLIEGLLFILLTLTGIREAIVNALPKMMRLAISVGIGLFITLVGLENCGIVVNSEATLVTLGDIHSPGVVLAMIGVILLSVLITCKVTGAMLVGIVVITLIGIPMGITQWGGIVGNPPDITPVFLQFDWHNIACVDMLICVMTLLFMDMFDTIGTIVGVSQQAGIVNKDGSIPRLKEAFMADAIGTTVGAMLGTSTTTTFVESASGVNAGGRSGLTAFVTAICFVLALFFAPLFLAIPSQATGPVLIIVGMMMVTSIVEFDFKDYADAIPAFICMVMMPMTYSIADGILMGVIAYVLIRFLSFRWEEVHWSMALLAVLFIAKYAFIN
ncbi:MAG: NCS2 family permease [Bacteroidales bacterium]|nr:NCS2 family permease [Bacteroidales bacterium]